jgi:hypothetical protein
VANSATSATSATPSTPSTYSTSTVDPTTTTLSATSTTLSTTSTAAPYISLGMTATVTLSSMATSPTPSPRLQTLEKRRYFRVLLRLGRVCTVPDNALDSPQHQVLQAVMHPRCAVQ